MKKIFTFLTVLACFSSSVGLAQTWQDVGGGTNNSSHCMTTWNGMLVDGGSFNNPCNRIATWNGTAWTCLGAGVGIVARDVIEFNGDLIAVGDFWNNGQPCTDCNGIARWDGTAWYPLGDGFNNDVLCLTVWNGQLVAGGDFTETKGGVPIDRVAVWNGTNWYSLGGFTTSFSNDVRTMCSYNGELWVGGDFNNVNGCTACDGVVKWDGSAWVGGNSGVDIIGGIDSTVRVLYVNPIDNDLYLGGHFLELHDGDAPSPDPNMSRIARYDGSNWFPLGSGVNDYVRAIYTYNGNIIVGGNFNAASGTTANKIAKWNPNTQTWSAMGSGMAGTAAYVKSATVYNGVFYAGGDFTLADGLPREYIASWYEPVSVPPVADFVANNTTVCVGATVNFTDQSLNSPTSWSWNFGDPGSGALNTSTLQNPSHVFNTAGTYTIVLTATNSYGSDNLTKTSYITVVASLPVSVNISANPGNVICAGTSVTFTATPTNGGTTPAYQWKLNGGNVGTNSSTYTNAGLVTGDVVTCVLNSNVSCASGNPATSNAITMTANPTVPVSVSIAANPGNTICAGTNVTFTATPGNGGTTPIYQWKLNGGNVGTNSTTYSNAGLATGDIVTCVLTSSLSCTSGNPATSNAITMTVNSSLPVSVSIAASPGNTICAGTSVTFTATPTNGGTTPSYQWKLNGANVGTNSVTYANASLATGDIVTCVLTSNVACPTGSPATSNAVTMTVNPSLPVSVSISAAPGNVICNGTGVTFTATPTSGGTTPAYQWMLNGGNVGTNSSTYTNAGLIDGDVVTCVLNSNASCTSGNPATSNAIAMTVTPSLPVSVNISASPGTTICAGTSVTFTAAPTNGGTTPSYQWKLNGNNVGTNSTTYTNAGLANGDIVTCVMTSNETCISGNPATSNAVSITVTSGFPVSVSITANPGNTICAGTSVTFSATPSNGGTSPSYQWKLNGANVGTNSSTYTNAGLLNGAIVTCVLTSSETCTSGNPATSNAILMTVNPVLVPSVSINASATTICAGTNVTFTATPTNGGTPTYQWKLNGGNVGINSPSYSSSSLSNGDIITCQMTSNANCASPLTVMSNSITLTVNPLVVPSVGISASATTICAGTNVTFSAVPTNGGTPTFQWTLNGSNVGTNSSTYSNAGLVSGDDVQCVMTSGESCASPTTATSNTITITVSSTVTPSVSIAASATTICAGTAVTFTATPIFGGTTPIYQWKLNGTNVGTNSPTYINATLTNGEDVQCVMTSSESCATPTSANSNTISITVSSTVTPTVSIAATATTICAGTNVTFTATPTYGGTTPTYQWKLNGGNVGANSPTYANVGLVQGDAVQCVLTSSEGCASPATANSNSIVMTVNPSLAVSINIAPTPGNVICAGTSVIFTASPVNGGIAPNYQWTLNGINVGPNATQYITSTLANNDVVACILTSSETCATGSPATSNAIVMTVNPSMVPSISIGASATTICAGTAVTFTATPTNGGTPSYQWKLNGGNVGANSPTYSNATLINGDAVQCVMTSSEPCATPLSANSNTITITVAGIVTPAVSITTASTTVCTGASATFTANPSFGGATPGYQWKLNGGNVGVNSPTYSNAALVNGDMIQCVMTSSEGCASPTTANSNTIAMTVVNNVPVSVSISADPGDTICAGINVLFTALPMNGGISPAYQWLLNGAGVGTGSSSYSNASLADGDVIVCVLTSGEMCTTGNPAASNIISMTVHALPTTPVITQSNDSLFSSILSGNQWYSAPSTLLAGETNHYFVPTSDGDYYVIATDSIGCSSDTSTIFNFVMVGVSDFRRNAGFQMYPNPTTGKFTLEFQNGSIGWQEIRIVNGLGAVIQKIELKDRVPISSMEIDLSAFSTGIYMIYVYSGENVYSGKIHKQ